MSTIDTTPSKKSPPTVASLSIQLAELVLRVSDLEAENKSLKRKLRSHRRVTVAAFRRNTRRWNLLRTWSRRIHKAVSDLLVPASNPVDPRGPAIWESQREAQNLKPYPGNSRPGDKNRFCYVANVKTWIVLDPGRSPAPAPAPAADQPPHPADEAGF